MEKVILYKVYYYEDYRLKRRYCFEDLYSAELGRFSRYCSYDFERLTTNNFVVPVSPVKTELVRENELEKIQFYVIDGDKIKPKPNTGSDIKEKEF